MLGAGSPIGAKPRAKAPASSMPPQVIVRPAPQVLAPRAAFAPAPAKVYYPPRIQPSARARAPAGFAAPSAGVKLAVPAAGAKFTAAAAPAVAVPENVLPFFRRPMKQINQRRGGGPIDTADDMLLDIMEGGGIDYPQDIDPQTQQLPAGTDTGQPDITSSPVDNGGGGGNFDPYDNTITYTDQPSGGEPYSVVESSDMDTSAGNYAPDAGDTALPDDPTMGDIFSDARAWLESINPVPRFTQSADALLAGFNDKFHQAQNAVRTFIGTQQLFDQKKAAVLQEIKKADVIAVMLRDQGRPADAQKVISAAAPLVAMAGTGGIDAQVNSIRAKIDEFNRAYSSYGVGLGDNVGYEMAATLMSVLVSLMTMMIPGASSMQDWIQRANMHIVNLASLTTGLITQAEYAEAESRASASLIFGQAFKTVAFIGVAGLALYLYMKWRKR